MAPAAGLKRPASALETKTHPKRPRAASPVRLQLATPAVKQLPQPSSNSSTCNSYESPYACVDTPFSDPESPYAPVDSPRDNPNSPRTADTPLTTYSLSGGREKRFFCPYPGCDRAYTRPCRLAEHINSHTNERPFKCTHQGCDKNFARDGHLRRHIESAHTLDRKHACDWPGCAKKFSTGTRLRRHRETHEGSANKTEFRCIDYPPCRETFRKHSTLQAHVASVHLKQKPYPCTHVDEAAGHRCSAAYESAANLRAHVAKHHGEIRFWCTLCSPELDPGADEAMQPKAAIGFRTNSEFQAHMRTAHPPTCVVCDKICVSREDLASHIEIHHTGAPVSDRMVFLCPHSDCERSRANHGFTKKGNLKVHIQTVHDKARPFVCGEFDLSQSNSPEVAKWSRDGTPGACGAARGTKDSLERHVLTHIRGQQVDDVARQKKGSKKKNKAARKNPSVLEKISGVSSGEPAVPVVRCIMPSCSQGFTSKSNLDAHLDTSHGFFRAAASERDLEHDALHGGRFWVSGIRGIGVLEGEAELAAQDRWAGIAGVEREGGADAEVPIDPALMDASGQDDEDLKPLREFLQADGRD